VARLQAAARTAAGAPLSGRIVPEIGLPNLREVLLRSYRIVYSVGDGAILVLLVMEGHRLLDKTALRE